MKLTSELIGKRVPVLDKGWVELQALLGDDLTVVNAARTSYLGESKGEDRDKKLLFYLMEHRHDGPFEMASMQFRIHPPEVVWRQLLRHRTGKYNMQSYRYMEAEKEEFYIPDAWRLQAKVNKQGSEGALNDADSAELTAELQEHYENAHALYQQALEKGVAREIARLFLAGFGLYSTGIVQMDLRNLLHFLNLRMAEDAQYEIRMVANVIADFVQERFPWTWEAYQRFRAY